MQRKDAATDPFASLQHDELDTRRVQNTRGLEARHTPADNRYLYSCAVHDVRVLKSGRRQYCPK